MNTEALIKPYEFQRLYLGLLTDDIADDQMTRQPKGVINHPAWQLGHIALVADNCIKITGGTPTLNGDWNALFGQKTTPVDERSKYPSKAELLRLVDDRRQALMARCAQLSDDDWKKPHPIESVKHSMPTVWHFMHFLMLTHEGTHLGQLATWRQVHGLPQALSKIPK